MLRGKLCRLLDRDSVDPDLGQNKSTVGRDFYRENVQISSSGNRP